MSEEQKGSKVPYRTKIETGGKKQYAVTNGPCEMKFIFQSTIFQEKYSLVTFTLDTLGHMDCRITGFHKTYHDRGYSFFGKTSGDMIIIGYYILEPHRSGWIRFYTRQELKDCNPEIYNILTSV